MNLFQVYWNQTSRQFTHFACITSSVMTSEKYGLFAMDFAARFSSCVGNRNSRNTFLPQEQTRWSSTIIIIKNVFLVQKYETNSQWECTSNEISRHEERYKLYKISKVWVKWNTYFNMNEYNNSINSGSNFPRKVKKFYLNYLRNQTSIMIPLEMWM